MFKRFEILLEQSHGTYNQNHRGMSQLATSSRAQVIQICCICRGFGENFDLASCYASLKAVALLAPLKELWLLAGPVPTIVWWSKLPTETYHHTLVSGARLVNLFFTLTNENNDRVWGESGWACVQYSDYSQFTVDKVIMRWYGKCKRVFLHGILLLIWYCRVLHHNVLCLTTASYCLVQCCILLYWSICS